MVMSDGFGQAGSSADRGKPSAMSVLAVAGETGLLVTVRICLQATA